MSHELYSKNIIDYDKETLDYSRKNDSKNCENDFELQKLKKLW